MAVSTDATMLRTHSDASVAHSSRHSEALIYSALVQKKFAKVLDLDSQANKCIQTCLEAESPQVNFVKKSFWMLFMFEESFSNSDRCLFAHEQIHLVYSKKAFQAFSSY